MAGHGGKWDAGVAGLSGEVTGLAVYQLSEATGLSGGECVGLSTPRFHLLSKHSIKFLLGRVHVFISLGSLVHERQV